MLKRLFSPTYCRLCNEEYGSVSMLKMIYHLKKVHKVKSFRNLKDIVFIIKWSIPGRVFRLIMTFLCMVFVISMWLITYPFYILHEFFDSIR